MANQSLGLFSRSLSAFRVKQERVRTAVPWVVLGFVLLSSAGCMGEKSVAELIQQLENPNAGYRYAALEELESRAEAGIDIQESVSEVLKVLQDSDRDNRYRAAKLLSKLGADPATVEGLASALKDPDPDIRYYVAKTLAAIGPDAEAAVPSIVEALRDKGSERSYYYLVKALKKIGPKALPALEELAQHPDVAVRREAAAAVEKIRAVGSPAGA